MDRLRELVVVARHLAHDLLNGRQQFVARLARLRPLGHRLEHDVAVGNVRRHGVGRDFRRAGARENAVDLGELSLQRRLQALLHRDRLRQAGTGNAQGLDGEVAFVQAGHELAAHAGGDQAAQHHCHGGCREHHRFGRHHAIQQRAIPALGLHNQEVFRLADPMADEQGDRCRDESHRQDHGPHECSHHRERHRVEHLPFHPRQGEDGQVDHHDDELPEQQRAA